MSDDPRLCAPENLKPGASPDDWFAHHVRGRAAYNRAMDTCQRCPLYSAKPEALHNPCAQYAIDEGIPDGIYGGMNAAVREKVWKRQGGRPKSHMDAYLEAMAVFDRQRYELEVSLGIRQPIEKGRLPGSRNRKKVAVA